MDSVNRRLSKEGHALMIIEELVGGRLYTGPLYHKYNHVLRAKSGNPFIGDMYRKMCKDNMYPTTIHAINSLIIKLSKLTIAQCVYRGFCYAKLPDSFWTRNTEGIRCGIEYGFSSTTTERSVAVHYGTGPAGTIMEMQMGLVDRGAELSWISQYPHEAEILFPPLTGLEMSSAKVDVNSLVIGTRLSVNLTALTLEQVVSKRRKMIMDMGDGMNMEIREELKDRPEDGEQAILLLKKGLEAGPFSFTPKWYNDDENFSRAVSMSLGLKKTVVVDGIKLPKSLDERQPLVHGSFKGYKPNRTNHQRVLLLAAWLKCNPKVQTLDLRSMGLERLEVDFLVHIFKDTPVIITADMRENGEMGVDAANQLVDLVLKADTNTVGSLCGVTKTKIALSIPRRDIPPTDLIFIATELEANSWAESNSGKGKPLAEIRRRSSHSYGDWSPLLFAAREGIPDLCQILIKRKADINQKDQDKLNPGYTALITAATRGDLEMVTLLVEADADLTAGDRNGKTAQLLADQRGYTEIVEYLASKVAPDATKSGPDEKDKDGNSNKLEDTKAPGDTNARRASLHGIGLYKGLQEKAANKEKERLSAAALLADARYERWLKLSEELKVAISLEAAAKAQYDEAMRAQTMIMAGNKARRGSVLPGNAASIMAGVKPRPAPPAEPSLAGLTLEAAAVGAELAAGDAYDKGVSPTETQARKKWDLLDQALRGQTQENLLAHIDGKESGSEPSSKAPTKRVSLPNKEAGKDSAKEAKEAGSGDGSGQEPGLSKSKSMP
uniref:NAD(P)(+)--arginine ADP-ribosyltransferase n=1 Tax=Haptolina ericina TaxID=156174 RepID=A0A7S3ET14_9EUKA